MKIILIIISVLVCLYLVIDIWVSWWAARLLGTTLKEFPIQYVVTKLLPVASFFHRHKMRRTSTVICKTIDNIERFSKWVKNA